MFFFSLSVCNLKNYNIVFSLQRTHFTNVFIQRLKVIAFVVSVTFCFRYILRVMSLSSLQIFYINDSNRPSNEKCKKIMGLYQIPSIQARYNSDSNRSSNEKMRKSWIFIECSLYKLFSDLLCDLQIFVIFNFKTSLSLRASFVLFIRIEISDEKFC